MKELKVIELFAGVGGFRLGLEGWQGKSASSNYTKKIDSPFKIVWSNQWEPSTKAQHASDVYVRKFGSENHSNVDISKVELKEIPDHDVLVGGFPCQDYSVANSLKRSGGLEGKKGVLWWEILRLVQLRKPQFVFLENVDRLLKSPSNQRGRDFAIMLKTLGDEGYAIEWRIVNAAEYGFPQRRIRVFIVATKIKRGSSTLDPEEVILKKGILARALPLEKLKLAEAEIELHDTADVLTSKFNKGGGKSPFLNAGYFVNGVAYTIKTVAKVADKPMVLGDILVPDSQVPDEYWIEGKRLKEWQYLKGAKSIERTHKGSGTKYNYAEGKMAFPDLLTNPSRTILTGEGGTSPSRFKHIIQTKGGYRRLMPIELERLNGFPDNWTQSLEDGSLISDARRAFFMGNALVIGLIQKVGTVLASEIRRTNS
jgi:DNA (cytosine-5)-methyltransferase 1